MDSSFNFYYQENLDALQQNGAELLFFSPLHDTRIPTDIHGILLGGGFPEIMSKDLNKNQMMMNSIKKIAETEIPVYAECGGLMYLCKSITGNTSKRHNEHTNPKINSKRYKMIGLIDASIVMTNKLILNYTQGKIINKSSLFEGVKSIRGHEFHYSEVENIHPDTKFSYILDIGVGIVKNLDGISIYDTLASYNHLHFSNSRLPKNFVSRCEKYYKK